MRAIEIDRFGTPDVLGIVETAPPVPAAGDVLIRAVATSINPVDDKTRAGVIGEGTPPLPTVLGWDLAGVVVDGGDSGWRVGERVIAMSHQLGSGRGTWADLVALPAQAIAAAPQAVSLVQAATLPLPGLTALQTLRWLEVSAGQRLLITGAAGAVGGLAVQLARAWGAEVDALVARDRQVALVRDHGAALVATDPGRFENRSYDAVLDTFGAFVTDAVRDGGRYASIATQAGVVPDVSSRGVRTTVHQVREDGDGLSELSRLVDRGSLRPRVHSVFGLHEIKAAHERFLEGGLSGKIVVTF
ncbi:NADP-dependent oxidoreductase [Embleya sp. NPDC050493]|uniref:NADP-dependent oxidoreductase n=1 Tax=Embleya sp. NPDC050493 TaxID=3363989 RepID=UPI0037A144F2